MVTSRRAAPSSLPRQPAARARPEQSPYEAIRAAILDGTLAPGHRLVETALADWCQVSRTPIREALRRLEQDGIVERKDRSFVVRERSPDQIVDIYETRIALETTAARMAAERRTSYELEIMRGLVEVMTHLDASDSTKAAATNREFHCAVWQASHNESLISLLERLEVFLAAYPTTTLAYPGRWDQSNSEHTKLLDAIAGRNAELAGEIAHLHFSTARDIRISLWRQALRR